MELAIIVPCYNEQEVLTEAAKRLLAVLSRLLDAAKISPKSKAIFVDDGSKDQTWSIIEQLCVRDDRISGIKLSRNRGHQSALLAGLFTANGDALVTIDADLQDDPEVIERMVDAFLGGVDVVYGVRSNRQTDTLFKRVSAQAFYRLMQLLGAESLHNHGDFRLMSRRAVESLKGFREVNLFLRGLVPLIGFRSEIVYYDRKERLAGETKYPLPKMIALAMTAITSFSVVPLRIITLLGFAVFLLSIAMMAWALGVRILTDSALPGWASTVLPVYFIGGVQILCIGVIGEYLGKIYAEVKGRPRYIIEKAINL
ncbi:MAG: glycosyltransferase [Gammaproteobacteria bacterium]